MKSKLTSLLLLLPFLVYAQEAVKDGVYRWPSFNAQQKNVTITMLTGSAYDLAYLDVSAQFLPTGKKTTVHVPGSEEQLLLVKNGTLTITLKDSVFSLSKGSIVMIMPEEKYLLQNKGSATCELQVTQLMLAMSCSQAPMFSRIEKYWKRNMQLFCFSMGVS